MNNKERKIRFSNQEYLKVVLPNIVLSLKKIQNKFSEFNSFKDFFSKLQPPSLDSKQEVDDFNYFSNYGLTLIHSSIVRDINELASDIIENFNYCLDNFKEIQSVFAYSSNSLLNILGTTMNNLSNDFLKLEDLTYKSLKITRVANIYSDYFLNNMINMINNVCQRGSTYLGILSITQEIYNEKSTI